MPKPERAVVEDFARVDEPRALEVVVENRGRPDAPRERDRELPCVARENRVRSDRRE